METALSVGLLILVVSALVDLWKLFHDHDLMLAAARHGARAAGAYAHELEIQGNLSDACRDTGGGSAVLTGAVSLAYKYLVAAHLETEQNCSPSGVLIRSCTGNSFRVAADFLPMIEGGLTQNAVRVAITTRLGPGRCLICAVGVLNGVPLRATTFFPVEANCAAL